MSHDIEVNSLIEGAWYDVSSSQCLIDLVNEKPHIQIKYTGYSYNDSEFFGLENLYQQRIRAPSMIAEMHTELAQGQTIVGFARAENESKWFDAEIVQITSKEDDILVTVEWKLGWYFFVFGKPLNRVLSVENGEVMCPGQILDPSTDSILSGWVEALRELSETNEDLRNERDRTPVERSVISKSTILSHVKRSQWTPKSLLMRTQPVRRHKKRRLRTPPTEEIVEPTGQSLEFSANFGAGASFPIVKQEWFNSGQP